MSTKLRAVKNEVYDDLYEFKQTRESVNELIKIRRALIDQEFNDLSKITAAKDKAMQAINNLFSEQ